MRLLNVDRIGRHRDFRRGLAFDGQKWQSFCIFWQNNGGTLRHAIGRDASLLNLPTPWADRIIGVKNDFGYTNTPTVSASVGFGGGSGGFAPGLGGGSTDWFVFNTADQSVSRLYAAGGLVECCVVEFYSGNNVRPRIIPTFHLRNVHGVMRTRFEIGFFNDVTGAAWNFNTTTLPNGQVLALRILVALQ